MEMENKKLRDVAEIARQIMVGEELKGGQKKIDKNHNNKIDGQDFAILRGQKAEVKKEEVSKPDFIDLDKDGNKKESMKKAVADKNMKEELKSETFEFHLIEGSYADLHKKWGDTHNIEYHSHTLYPKHTVTKFNNEKDAKSHAKKTGGTVRMSVSPKMKNEEVEELDEVSLKTATSAYVKRMGDDGPNEKSSIAKATKTMDHIANKHGVKGVARATKTADDKYGLNDPVHNPRKAFVKQIMQSVKKEDVDAAAATILEYESKDGKFVHRARPGAYGGTKDERHAVDTLAGPKTKELKAIESEKKKKMSEMVATYKEQGLKGLFEALKKDEVIVEEPTSAEFDAQLADAKQRAAGTKKQPEISKPAVQAVQNEETHTTVEVIDFDPINGVQHSEIDLEERQMTEPEMKKKEEIVKSMKKGMQGFKDRYGDRAKEVIYATATKQAMKEGAEDHYQTGHDYASDHAIDSGFKATARARKKEMLSDNPHKKGSSEHDEWHKGALAGHQTGLDNM
jgi:hypothetical protein